MQSAGSILDCSYLGAASKDGLVLTPAAGCDRLAVLWRSCVRLSWHAGLLLLEHEFDVRWAAHVRVDTTMSTVRTPPLLLCLVDLQLMGYLAT